MIIDNEKNVLSIDDAFMLNPQSLAFLGDGVFSLYVRLHFCASSTAKSGVLHKKVVEFVKATYQSKALDEILKTLSEKELQLVKRARNTKVANISKHATIEDYHKSTAFEALLGYLYLTGQKERLNEILELSVSNFGERK